MVENVLMPPIGYMLNGVDFKTLAVNMPVIKGEPVLIKYGLFVQAIVDFLIIALVLFLVIKGMNKMKKRMAAQAAATPPPPPAATEMYLKEIRDALVARK